MFHYPCLLVESGCWEWGRCRDSPSFAVNCRLLQTAAKMPYSAVLRRLLQTFADFQSRTPAAIPLVVESLKTDGSHMAAGSGANESDKRNGKWASQTRSRLSARREEKPLTKAGQIRALWPEIEAALGTGQSLTSIRDWLEDEGVVLSMRTLSSYKTRLRRKEKANRQREALEAFVRPSGDVSPTPRPVQEDQPKPQSADKRDPFAQARRALEKTFDIRTIHGDGDPTGRNLV